MTLGAGLASQGFAIGRRYYMALRRTGCVLVVDLKKADCRLTGAHSSVDAVASVYGDCIASGLVEYLGACSLLFPLGDVRLVLYAPVDSGDVDRGLRRSGPAGSWRGR